MFLTSLSIGNLVTLLILFLPFIFVPSLYNPYELPKFAVYVTLAIVLGAIAWVKSYVKGELFIAQKDTLTWLVLLYLVVAFLANLYGIDPQTSMRGSPIRHQGLLLLFANVVTVLLLRSFLKEQREKIFLFFQNGVFFTTSLLCLFTLYQIVGAFLFHASIPLYQGRIVGTFGNPNFLGGYLAMVLPFILFGKRQIIIKTIVVSMMAVVIFLTGSRAAILALGMVFWWNHRLVAMVFALLVIITSIGLFQLRESQWDNRLVIWQGGWEAFLRRPILGYGQENFELAFTKVGDYHLDNAHNIFLEIAVSSGVVGLFSFLALFFYAFKKAPLQIKISLMLFLIVAQFNPLSIAQIALFWFLLGIL